MFYQNSKACKLKKKKKKKKKKMNELALKVKKFG